MNTTDNKQAGAVGYIRDDGIQELNEGRLNIALWANPSFGVKTPVYTTPPAAVPVEALEWLVEALRKEAATIAKPYGFVTEHILGKAEGLESCAERIEQLIKERSNG